ncbi:phage major capsid protein [Aromatoleum evansii]|uniref:Phage major capsid protein n=1 Tax=Aromatoleum evansii TaxID=59406 RepID=A0ABZ1AUD8_AROEV|nr:phage major capsid protein [Aromatoleum evansii]
MSGNSLFEQREIIRAHELDLRAELAKMGIPFECGDSRSDIVSHRADVRRAINAVRDRQIARIDNFNNLSDKEKAAYERDTKVMDAMQALIEVHNITLEKLDLAPPPGMGSDSSSQAWKQNDRKIRVLSPSDRLAEGSHGPANFGFGEYVRAMAVGTSNLEIRAALAEGTDSAGGYSVPRGLMAQLIDRMRAKTVCVQAGALTVPLETNVTSIARLASDPSAGWRAENAAVAESDPTFEGVTFTARSLAVLVKVSLELLQDSVNIEEALMTAFAGSLAGEVDRVALFGSGTAPEPRGIFNTTNVGSVSMGANGAALTNYGKILDVLYELEVANAAAPTGMVMHPRTSRVLNGLADTTGQPLRMPEALAGIPRFVTTATPIDQTQGTANNASAAVMGNFRELLLGVRQEMRIEVLRERFAENLQYGFIAHLRMDVAVAHPQSFCKLIGIIP